MNLLPTTIFEVQTPPDLLAGNIQLRAKEWLLWAMLDGERSLQAHSEALDFATEEGQQVMETLLSLGLAQEKRLGPQQAARQQVGAVDSSREDKMPFRDFLKAGVKPEVPTILQPLPTPEEKPQGYRFRAISRVQLPTPPPPTKSFQPLELPTNKDMPTTEPAQQPVAPRELSILKLMRFIMSRSNDQVAGQLLVYRVFLGVKSELLHRNGITALRFHEDHRISDEVLIEELGQSVQKQLGVRLPDNVFL